MYNKKQLICNEIKKNFAENSCAFAYDNFDNIRTEHYEKIGITYWTWIDMLANLEAQFSKDVVETTEKFKIETVDSLIDALYNAPEMKSLYKKN